MYKEDSVKNVMHQIVAVPIEYYITVNNIFNEIQQIKNNHAKK